MTRNGWFGGGRRRAAAAAAEGEPIRAELFSVERLEQHARSLAVAQRVVGARRRQQPLVARLRANATALRRAYHAITAAVADERTITPAAAWLIDNFHIVEEQIRQVQDDLPDGFYRQLPKLVDGPLAGCPRVFGVTWAFVAHTDSLFDPQALRRFVQAYQGVQPLTIGELWAVAITLRVVLVENLRRSAEAIVARRLARKQADTLAELLVGGGAEALRRQGTGPLAVAFAAQLVQRLRDQDPVVAPGLHWLDERLGRQGTTADEVVRLEHQHLGAMNVTVRNVITSMRLMSAIDWNEFVESVSLVDVALAAQCEFGAMDFSTRDRYRHAVEALAAGSGRTELDVVALAVAAARSAPGPGIVDPAMCRRRQDPGFHLVGGGRRAFEREVGFRAPARSWPRRARRRAGIHGYLAVIGLFSVLFVAGALLAVTAAGATTSTVILFAVLALVPAADLAVAIVNRCITRQLGPTALPGLELRDGVPAGLRTLVAVPTLLTSRASIDEQVRRLEVHHLASPDDDLCFALLTDWTDAVAASVAGDEDLLAAAAAGIARLNADHGPAPGGARFLLLHRRRVWNAVQQRWIGWERKRGKLHELNRWLRGAGDTTFLATADGPVVPRGVRYVITLDADTRMPRGCARRLVGKMAHPLNRPTLDQGSGRVVEGHAVLQPRITPSLPMDGEGSLLQRVSSGPCGLDPYAFAVSDVYQDLLGEGSYTGKGIYDVDVFEAAMAGRIPENSVLSHDLLEGLFTRAGLASDVELVEEQPARHDVAAARQHRWARGDWQLLPWIVGRRRRGAIPLIGRWKMIDNLRRTLVAPAALLLLLVGWVSGMAVAMVISGFVLATIALPFLLPVAAGITPRRRGVALRHHARAVGGDLLLAAQQTFLSLTFLAHQAWLMGDAIVRTLARLASARGAMLEWLTAAQARFGLPLDLHGFCHRMVGSLGLVGVVVIVVVVAGRDAWPVAAPVVGLWLLAPWVAERISREPTVARRAVLAPAEAQFLRLVARRTWSYFEAFVGADDHHLPPDNFQEDPTPVIAHRTSPTNIGLHLLASVAARDLGWVGTSDTIATIERVLDTVACLEHHHGHLYNWYDTRDLRPLAPRYVSSVDSGNFAGHLIALGSATREWLDTPAVHPSWAAGLGDALALARGSLEVLVDERSQHVPHRLLEDQLAAIASATAAAATNSLQTVARLTEVAALVATANDMARALAAERQDGAGAELLAWVEAAAAGLRSHGRDVEELMPWARLLTSPTPAATADVALVMDLLVDVPSMSELPERCELAIGRLAGRPHGAAAEHTLALIAALTRSAAAARGRERRLAALHARVVRAVQAMDFRVLFDHQRQLLSIGYQVGEGRLDPGGYDLLASEARLASFVAIAKGDVPVKHWFRLGRSLTPVGSSAALVSWSGSLFEYLMPSLVMEAPIGSLLDRTCRLVVARQIEHGAALGVPWGISESAYNARDAELTYQYSAFGVPGLGRKRGLDADLVVAPYATGLAVMVDARAAVANLKRLAAVGAYGRYGYYEALDYTPSRRPPGTTVAVVRAYMAHHQGMILVAIANALDGGAMRTRFHADPRVQATELLLQERMPRTFAMAHPTTVPTSGPPRRDAATPPTIRRFHTPHTATPRTHLLSNGRYAVMLTTAGAGYSRWCDLAVTRWREDVTCDPWGTFVFVRDVHSGEVWSAGHQPTGVEPDSFDVAFSEGRAEFVRRDGSMQTTLEVVVSPENDAEVRRVSVTNLGSQVREVELTSYAEVVLASSATDAAHPTFARLFVQTEHVASLGALLATRRRRSPDEPEVWAAHIAVAEGDGVGNVQFETDRARFLGRGRTVRAPIAVTDGRRLSGTTGTVLDAVFSIRHRLRILPGTTARIAFWTMVATTRQGVLDLADKHRDATAFERAVTLAWTQAQVQLQHLGIDHDEAHLFQELANCVVYADPTQRPPSGFLQRNVQGPATLWAHGISADLPIVLVRIEATEDLEIVRQLLRAHEYWQIKRLAVDLVILNERASSYTQDLNDALATVVRVSHPRPPPNGGRACGGVFVLRSDQLPAESVGLLNSVARAVVFGRRGSLVEQLRRRGSRTVPPPVAWGSWVPEPEPRAPRTVGSPVELEFANGLGGFADDGREYVITLGEGQWTPAPWLNVIANAAFGFQVAAEGGGYTWSVNSRENQITASANDPVGDAPGEVVYVRDLVSGAVWGPTALPCRLPKSTYVARHGQGYSRFLHEANGIVLELLQYVPLDDPIKISRLRLYNRSGRVRRLSVTAYVEWVLGTARGASAPHVVTESDAASAVLLARNPWRSGFGERVAFADLGGRQTAWTADRTEFLGRNGTLERPLALASDRPLSRRCGAGLDPCAALQAEVRLLAGADAEIVFFLGDAGSRREALALVARYRALDLAQVLRSVMAHWDAVLGVVQVRTPDRSMDLLLNRWLLYQTLACRVWARAALYQASGAYGFRDQLQDGMALAVARPDLTREHLLRAAGRQFVAGDVQHWWLPHSGEGVRTRVADDAVWLPYAIAHYVEVTGDEAVLAVLVPFLDGAELAVGETESFSRPVVAEVADTLFEHGARALDRSLAVGAHGLPLIGSGDWNDGLNRVGAGGRGESVWLGWFLHATLAAFVPLARARGQAARVESWQAHMAALQAALEREAWDGSWYRRGYFDDGTPLGAAGCPEAWIDSIAQSWAVISGAAEPARARQAMASVDEHLVRRADGLILLFTPPFDRAAVDPGYIKGYPPGIRENGGQYTHAAVWTVIACATLGDGDRAAELFAFLNPIRRAATRAEVFRYKVEPYVVAADVYSMPPHVGRGGWTWYTGSAGWLYRAGLEWLLGLRLRGATLLLDPCIPGSWKGFAIDYRHRGTIHHIVVENPDGRNRGVRSLEVDGMAQTVRPAVLLLRTDGLAHRVRVVLGDPPRGDGGSDAA